MIARRRILAAGAGLLLASPARAEPAILLTVAGRLSRPNHGMESRYDLAMLDALPQGSFSGPTPWLEQSAHFTGPLLSAVLDDVGAMGTALEVSAINDYMAVIPASDARTMAVILATRLDGQPMPVRARGPLWVIYPMDRDPALRNEAIYAKSVWQVARITIR